MNDKQILFQADMIRALLDGRKTQTRRIVKPELASNFDEPRGQADVDAGYPFVETDGGFISAKKLCPWGQPGDLLWCRETWTPFGDHILYRADGDPAFNNAKGLLKIDRWHPSIHMPRWASRLTLRITDVRMERLQDISEIDALAEGIEGQRGNRIAIGNGKSSIIRVSQSIVDFVDLWNYINAKRGYGWKANPWVWVIEFEVIHKNIDQVLRETSK